MVNYGYGPGIRSWDESKKGILANSLEQLIDQIKKGSNTELADACMSSDDKAPYIEVNGIYPGVRIRKITHLNDEQQRELITKADLIYTEIMRGLIAKHDFDGIWEFINNHVLDNTLENERDTVLIPDMHEWDEIKKLLMKKRLSKTDYRTFSNISASLPKKVYDLGIGDYFDGDVLEKKCFCLKKSTLAKCMTAY